VAQAIVAYSDYVATYFRNLIGGRPIYIIPNGVSPELTANEQFSTHGNHAGSLNIAYCGTVASHKGPHVILEALRIARLNSVNLSLIGHAPEHDYVNQLREAAAAVRGLNLKFYGKYERSELPLLLLGVDCVIVPSLVPEAGPIVPREALACGVPILVSRLGALPEVITDGENGFTFDPQRPEDLADILRRIAVDLALLNRLRAGARQSPTSTVTEHAERICQVYDHALHAFEKRQVDLQDASELTFLREAVARLGCDSSHIHKSREVALP
jgi:glycosyltransferase involved in cell wall biosynthesis